jgi:hypothetical protein
VAVESGYDVRRAQRYNKNGCHPGAVCDVQMPLVHPADVKCIGPSGKYNSALLTHL